MRVLTGGLPLSSSQVRRGGNLELYPVMKRHHAWFWGLLFSCVLSWRMEAATLPVNFSEQQIGGTWNEAVGLLFEDNGRMYVWERGGRVWIVENGVKSATPLIDISEEVGGWRDFGLLGFVLDPNFRQNGYIYLLYVVDRHYLMNFGTPNYNPASNQYFAATIGRITRYTARSSDGFRSVDMTSRRVLLGETKETGIPILHESHGVGSLVFGTDGTLLASCGDAASYNITDVGSASETYYAQALTDGIIKTKENVGAYRAQLVDSHNGKVLRIDPASGDGIPGNPFYDAANPRAPKSRVWALGLRNPCRMTLKPGTGSHNRADANPGVLMIGDVGWNTYEDLNICTGPGQNFGWPAFEGQTVNSSYYNSNVQNLDAPNPLYPGTGCSQFFYFRDLIKQDTLVAANRPPFNNPCNAAQKIPGSIPQFLHSRPSIDWQHGTSVARVPTFNADGSAGTSTLGTAGCPVAGASFPGNCSIGGVWYQGTDFPAQYQNTFFSADYGAQWIKNFVFDANGVLTQVRDFASAAGGVVSVATSPVDGGIYYISWTATLMKIFYASNGNLPPKAVATVDRNYGPGPLAVQFTGSGSSDPENQALTYSWNFGDGSPTSTAANPAHTYNAAAGVPTKYTATLTVTDSVGQKSTATVIVSVNNTPPTVQITNPIDGSRYLMTGDTVYNLTADVTDVEFSDAQLLYEWQTILHHNNHEHLEPIDNNHVTGTVISPAGCDGNTYYYRIVLTVTDPAGLSAQSEVRLYPDCPNQAPIASFTANPSSGFAPLVVNFDGRGSGDPDGDGITYAWDFGDGSTDVGQTPAHTYAAVGSYTASLTVTDTGGLTHSTSVPISVAAVPPPGLEGTYFDNINLTTPVLTRNDAPIDFDYGTGSPDPLIGPDTFSVRWLGRVKPQYSESYTFYAVTDDGFKLWVNDQLLIDSWIDQAPTERISTPIALLAGVDYSIKIEYYENGGGAVARLLWSSPSQVKQVVPAGRLLPPGPAALPAPWQHADVGAVGLAGNATYSNGTFNVSGSGTDIWDAADAFHFVYQPWTGNAEIIARVDTVGNTDPWAKTGVMIRETLAAGSRHAMMAITPANGAAFQRRLTTDGISTHTAGPIVNAPYWVRLVRIGTTITGYISPDGAAWTAVASDTISLSSAVYVGLPVTAHNNAALSSSALSGVIVRVPPGNPPGAPANLTATAASTSQINLAWSAGTGSTTGYILERSPNGTSFAQIATLPGTTTAYSDTGLSAGTTYFYRVAGTNAFGKSAYSAVASTATLASTIKINFQPAKSPVPAGYLVDSGSAYGNRGNGYSYGWNKSNTGGAHDQNSSLSPDQRYDTFVQLQKTGGGSVWEIALPNGNYSVFAVAGDPLAFNSVYRINAEGVLTVSGTPTSASRWVSGTKTVTVSDGRLTIGNGSGASNNKICFIEITPVAVGALQAAALRSVALPVGQVVELTGFDYTNGRIRFHVEGAEQFTIEASQDLQSWERLSVVPNGDGSVSLDEPIAKSQRFFRATIGHPLP